VKTRNLILSLLVLLPVSCAKDSGAEKKQAAAPTGARIRTADEWLDDTTKDNGYKTDANGNLVPRSGQKRSSFENKGESPYFKGEYSKKNYKAGEYAKKSWWGNKDYGRQEYAGNTDGSRFQKNSRFDGKGARESGSAADIPGPYQTENYATGAAREAGKGNLTKPGNAEIENRREVYQQPDVVDWREQRKLSMEQSKGILGR